MVKKLLTFKIILNNLEFIKFLRRLRNSMKIYIIEDDRVLRTELMKLLCSYGYQCDYSEEWQNIIQLALQSSPDLMLMYGKEASNRKQEIDRQHYTIPNQRPKDKHCGKI